MERLKIEDSLVDHVQKTGFPNTHEAQIREGIRSGAPEFKVNIPATINGVQTENELLFKQDKRILEKYYFNEYQSKINNRPEDEVASRPVVHKVNTQFPNNTITLQESINLRLTGSVEKEISHTKLNPENGVSEIKRFTTWKKANQTVLNEYGEFPLISHKYNKLEAELFKKAIVGKHDPLIWKELVRELKAGGAPEVVLKSGREELRKWVAIDVEAIGDKIRLYDYNPRAAMGRKLNLEKTNMVTTAPDLNGAQNSPVQIENSTAKEIINGNSIEEGNTTKVVPLYPEVGLSNEKGPITNESASKNTIPQDNDTTHTVDKTVNVGKKISEAEPVTAKGAKVAPDKKKKTGLKA